MPRVNNAGSPDIQPQSIHESNAAGAPAGGAGLPQGGAGGVDPALTGSQVVPPEQRHVSGSAHGGQPGSAPDGEVLHPASLGSVEGQQPMHVDGPASEDPQKAAGDAAIAEAEELLNTVFQELEKADEKEIKRRDRLIGNILNKLPDDAPPSLVSGLATAQTHLCALQTGREQLAAMRASLEDLCKTDVHGRADKLEKMADQWQALEDAELELSMEEKTGTPAVRLFREDLAACREIMHGMVSMAMENLIPKGTNSIVRAGLLSAPVAEAIATLKLRTGAALAEIAAPIVQGMTAAQAVMNKRDMEESLPAILKELARDRSPQNINAMADYLFMDSYPGTMDTALLLKKALVPQTPEARRGVELLHTLGAARRAIFEKLFPSEKPNPETAASVRSFNLTLSQMQKLAGASGMRDMGYQIANLIALEVRACRSGLLDHVLLSLHPGKKAEDLPQLREEAAANIMREAAQKQELGINRIVECLTAVNPSADAEVRIESAMLEAARRFTIGLMGLTQEEHMENAIAASSKNVGATLAEASKKGMFSNNALSKSAAYLDICQVRLTGIMDPKKRPISGDPEGVKRRTMDGAMRIVFGSMLMEAKEGGRELLLGENGLDLAHVGADMEKKLQKLGGHRAEVEEHAAALLQLAPLEKRRPALKARLHALKSRSSASSIAAMKAAVKAIGKAHSRQAEAERIETARTVLRAMQVQKSISEINEQIARSPGSDAQGRMEELQNLQEQLNGLLLSLDGVDPLTLLRTRPRGTHPTLEQLAASKDAARGLLYFNGDFQKRDRQDIAALEAEIRRLDAQVKAGLSRAGRLFGAANVARLKTGVAAAFMDVFIQSGQNEKEFKPLSEDVLKKVHARLAYWALPAGKGSFLEFLVQRAASRLSAPDGSLNVGIIERTSAADKVWAGLLQAASRQALQEQGNAKITSQTIRRRDDIAAAMQEQNKAARRSHGLGTTLASLGAGEGFIFDLSKGGKIELGFNPDTSNFVSANVLSLTPSVTIGALRENQLAVHADGMGGFMVSLRSENTGSIGLGVTFSLGSAALNAPDKNKGEEAPLVGFKAKAGEVKAEGRYERGSSNGVMLHFSSAEACRDFLTDFMDPNSSLHKKESAGARLWLNCDSLFTVSGGHVTKSCCMGVTAGKLEASSFYVKGAVTGLSVSLVLSSTSSTFMEQNAHGYTEVAQSSGNVSFTFSKSIGVGANLSIDSGVDGMDIKVDGYQKKLSPFKKGESAWKPASVSFTSRTSRLYDGTITGGSSISCSMVRGGRDLEVVLRTLGLDEQQVHELLLGRKSARVRKVFDAADNDAVVSVKWKLTAAGLARLRRLESSMRLAQRSGSAGGRSLDELRQEYERLLKDRSLYEPAEFSIQTAEKVKVGTNVQVFAYTQKGTVSNLSRTVVNLLEG